MSNASASAFSLWSILSVLFLIFLVHHLWCYDRFKCLRWTAGRQPGAFKRVMTYTYLCAVPLFAFYSVGMTVIKVREGYTTVPGSGDIIPVPIDFYNEENRVWVLPLQFVFSIAWALEQVTHLEELAFWLYLLHQNPHKEAWFSSWEYRLWYMGSILALIGMPLTALITRNDLSTCDAYIFLVGSAGSLSTTIAFLYVLWRFPKFIRHVKAEGADPTVVVRLATFYQLNQVRIVFRFLFTLPLLILALDGVVGKRHIVNHNLFVTDFLTIVAGLGCFVSSMITLLIFFPRSIVREAGYKPKPSSSAAPSSPKSAPITPTSQSNGVPLYVPDIHAPGGAVQYSPGPSPRTLQGMPAHMVAYAHQHYAYGGYARRMSATNGTYTTGTGVTWDVDGSAYTYTPSARSPRESLYDSPMYTTDEGEGGPPEGGRSQRRGSRVSRRASRKYRDESECEGAFQEEDEEGLEEEDGEIEGEGERVPPYSHGSEHPTQPPQAHLHQRTPFPHANSSAHLAAAEQSPPPSTPPQPQTPKSPPPKSPPPPETPTTPSRPFVSKTAPPNLASPPHLGALPSGNGTASTKKEKRRTWDWQWEERRPPLQLGRARSLHFIAGAPNLSPGPGAVFSGGGGGGGVGGSSGASVGAVGLVNLNSGPGAPVVGQTREGVRRGALGGSSLHPYVVNFTSPIDLVDLPSHEDLPRA